jgi:ribosomal protein S14
MKYKRLNRDIIRRKLYKNSEIFQRVIKVILLDVNQTKFKCMLKQLIVQTLKKNSYKTQIKNFCIFSGRSRSIYKQFKVSRINILKLSCCGYFFGLKKAS